MKKQIITLALYISAFGAVAQSVRQDSIIKPELDPVILELDKLSQPVITRQQMFANSTELEQSIAMTPDQLPQYSEQEIRLRLKKIPTIIPLDYNSHVKSFIDLFVYRKREFMTRMLASSQVYFPLFEEVLDRKGMPHELKYLAVIESAMNPTAVSRAGATGIWQLMIGTGKMLGCDANSCVDERRDPRKSTEAAATYLKQLYNIYGDWQLALAAYNSGPGNVNKAIARAGTKNFWAISPYLPAETRSYVPTYIAMAYVMHYAKDYKILSAQPKRDLYQVDSVMITAKVSLEHIANTLGIPKEEIQFLNPSLKIGIVPLVQNGFPLNLPVNYFVQFESKRDIIMNDPLIKNLEANSNAFANPDMIKVAKIVYHKVRSGENISNIARKYGVTVSEIKKWNRLRSSYLNAGQKLKINKIMLVPNPNAVLAKSETPAPDTSAVVVSQAEETEIEPNTKIIVEEDSLIQEEYLVETDENGNITKRILITEPKVETPATKTTATAPAKAQTEQKNLAVAKDKIIFYKVQSGHTLWNIAQRYEGLTIQKLRELNGLSSKSVLKKGQVLKILL